MDVPAPQLSDLAGALLSARTTVVLTGRRLNGDQPPAAEAADGWDRAADLDVLMTDPGGFWRSYLPLVRTAAAREPTSGHRALSRLQSIGAVEAIVTQAVDGLHSRAGSTRVIEVYGNALGARCERCGQRYDLAELERLIITHTDGVPRCVGGCGFPLRPAGTLWNEALSREAIESAWEMAAQADLFVVVDSDLRTAPISLLPSVPLTNGVPVIIVGTIATQYHRYAHQVIPHPGAKVLERLATLLQPHAT